MPSSYTYKVCSWGAKHAYLPVTAVALEGADYIRRTGPCIFLNIVSCMHLEHDLQESQVPTILSDSN